MKRFSLVLIALLFSAHSFSQITLGTADFPHLGDIDTISTATAFSGMDYLTTGANQTWDFANLDSTTTGQRIDTFISVSTAGSIFSLYFGFLNPANHVLRKADLVLGPVSFTGVYDFFYNSPANYHQSGFGATVGGLPVTLPITSIPLGYVPSDIIYKFPVKFGNVDSCAPVDTLGIPGLLYYKNSKTRLNEVDGWGKVTTPYGTFDCLRLKSTIHEHDTIYLDTLGTGTSFDLPEQIEYKWLGKDKGQPLVIVVTTAGVVSEITYYGYPVCSPSAFSVAQDTIVEGTTLNFTNATKGSNKYQWKINGVPYSTNIDTACTFNTPGVYTVTLVSTHLSCVDSTSRVITVFYQSCNLTASYIIPQDTIYDGTTLNLTNSSAVVGSFVNYQWKIDENQFSTNRDTSYKFNIPGTYVVTMTATDLNCMDSTSKVITVFYTTCNLGSAFNASNQTIFKGQDVSFSGSSGAPVKYEWRLKDDFFSNAKDTSNVFNEAGTYKVTLVTSYLNCMDSITRYIEVLPRDFNLEIYPNPISKDVTVFCALPENSDIRIEMIDMLGQTLTADEWKGLPAGEHNLFLSIPPSSMASSLYFVKIKWKNGEFVKRIAVTK